MRALLVENKAHFEPRGNLPQGARRVLVVPLFHDEHAAWLLGEAEESGAWDGDGHCDGVARHLAHIAHGLVVAPHDAYRVWRLLTRAHTVIAVLVRIG